MASPAFGIDDAAVVVAQGGGVARVVPDVGAAVIDKHRRAMCGRANAPQGKDCDEYPFAATKEGGNPRRGSTRIIAAGDNRSAGARLGGFYKVQRVLNGDAYYVHIK